MHGSLLKLTPRDPEPGTNAGIGVIPCALTKIETEPTPIATGG